MGDVDVMKHETGNNLPEEGIRFLSRLHSSSNIQPTRLSGMLFAVQLYNSGSRRKAQSGSALVRFLFLAEFQDLAKLEGRGMLMRLWLD